MIQTFSDIHASLSAVLTRLGMGDYTTALMVLAPLVALAVLRLMLTSLAYRPLTAQEEEQARFDPEMVHLLETGRIRRF